MKNGEKKINPNKLISYILEHKYLFLIATIMLLITSGLTLIYPYLTGKIIDILTSEQKDVKWNINELGGLMLLLIIVQSTLTFGKSLAFSIIAEKIIKQLRIDLFSKYISMPLNFFDQHSTGSLISRLNNDLSVLKQALTLTISEILRQTVILILGLALIFIVTPKLSILMVCTLPVVIIIGNRFSKHIRSLHKESYDHLASSNSIVEEALLSIVSVKSFLAEDIELNKFRLALEKVYTKSIKAANYQSGYIAINQILFLGVIITLTWYGTFLVMENQLSTGNLISFILYTTFIGGSISSLSNRYTELQKAFGASENIRNILYSEEEYANLLTNQHTHNLKQVECIKFENVNFSYPTRDTNALNNFNLEIGHGEKIALIGQSGSGKSTLVKLLVKFYDTYDGKISINNIDLKEINTTDLRSRIGIVPQEVILFEGSIKDNIKYGLKNASDEEIYNAAKKANANNFIESLPNGYNTLVGPRGIKLSGGQRQRIAIARVILKNPPILILDEATSSLDVESEFLIKESFNELMKDRTTIIIAHRLSTIEKADRIVVLKGGYIVECGTHRNLFILGNEYANFVKLQTFFNE